MDPRYLFFAGEPATTLPLPKPRPAWSPVLSAITFNVTAGRLHRGIGEEQRGEGKHLIRAADDIPRWDGIATMEPFFEGESVRVLVLGERAFGVRIRNETSWIKNSPGASVEAWEPDAEIIAHARRATRLFDLNIAGIDYVIDTAGAHFIELNPFPRVGLSKESAAVAREMFHEAMDSIEARCR